MAWCKRFKYRYNARNPTTETLKNNELFQSLLCIVKNTKISSFLKKIYCLKKDTAILNISMINFCPFLDNSEIIVIMVVVEWESLMYLNKNILWLFVLNISLHFVLLIIFIYFHASAETTLSLIWSIFWILSATNAVSKIAFNNCIVLPVKKRTLHMCFIWKIHLSFKWNHTNYSN